MEGCALSAHPSPILVALAAYGKAVRDLEKKQLLYMNNSYVKREREIFFFFLD